MRYLGVEISEDGETYWRNNGGCIERKAMYTNKPHWENVSGSETPRTPEELEDFCKKGDFGYRRYITKKAAV